MINDKENIDFAYEHRLNIANLTENAKKYGKQRPLDPGFDFDDPTLVTVLVERFKGIRPVGWSVLLRLITEPQIPKDSETFIKIDSEHKDQVYSPYMGVVLSVAPGAYSITENDKRYEITGAWCKVGDVVIFPKTAGFYLFHNTTGIPLYCIQEHAPCLVVDNIEDAKALSRN
jgi:Chaperonin 10 Kd subunit